MRTTNSDSLQNVVNFHTGCLECNSDSVRLIASTTEVMDEEGKQVVDWLIEATLICTECNAAEQVLSM